MGQEDLHGWLLKFGEDIKILLTSLETFIDCLANNIPPWAAYCAFLYGCLITLDKQLGVHPVGVRENWRLIFNKIVIKVTGPESTMACQDDQPCAGLKAEIGGSVHGVQAIWDEKSTTKDWICMLVEAKKTFNEINQIRMLWTVRTFWPSGACFVFICYYHW